MARQHHENFPVASFLLPADARKAVVALYHFARGADDIADNPQLLPAQREAALAQLDAVLAGEDTRPPAWAEPYVALCRAGHCNAQDGRDLLKAFLWDQQHTRCPDWEGMLGYCHYSAVPVGRSFLALCGESSADPKALAALCCCLQIINHLQDVGQDYRILGRVYLPADWLQEAGVAVQDLAAAHSSDALRSVIKRVLAAMEPLMEQAEDVPASLRSRRLAWEIRWVIAIVKQLHRRLGEEDPLAARIAPGWRGKLAALAAACLGSRPARSNFYWPIRLAQTERQSALLALHRFLRAIDNAADSTLADASCLEIWHQECTLLAQGQPQTPEGKALHPYLRRYQLEARYLQAVVEGCAMDVRGETQKPDAQTLTRYCENVAVAPGMLVLAILGYASAGAYPLASALGQAFQRTNILRDAQADARLGRVYFSPLARQEFIREAEQYYQEAARLLAQIPARELVTVRLMRDVYWRLFCRLVSPQSSTGHTLPTLPYLMLRRLRYQLGRVT